MHLDGSTLNPSWSVFGPCSVDQSWSEFKTRSSKPTLPWRLVSWMPKQSHAAISNRHLLLQFGWLDITGAFIQLLLLTLILRTSLHSSCAQLTQSVPLCFIQTSLVKWPTGLLYIAQSGGETSCARSYSSTILSCFSSSSSLGFRGPRHSLSSSSLGAVFLMYSWIFVSFCIVILTVTSPQPPSFHLLYRLRVTFRSNLAEHHHISHKQ